ncbi:type 1 glutamine amidotransferase [Rubellicoccus peritrichatus]|uniref:Gamma-glutamyl-gamma-aminobutyrate hydrolase family protein n=1 Tax=Rubellicoccus peritrichatus TaxID=3080537 RepID=A0AAQ3L7S5_9BACT|nr:gamma-glutamyl-gamma-aminobutyrate hydrolase family protein [Puniceicoccus sp. CR14]WOO41204.1 gamma-glutamyl-gamma-aminobutyrate hydrolase family protein [Puniceicoccus sp. CR14]
MRAHYFQHVPFEGLGSIEPWLESKGYEITKTQFFDTANIPELKAIDLLIVMGGPMSINDGQEYPWLIEEKAFIRRAVEAGKPVLGICLGAQLIAGSLGSRVYQNNEKEIGWFPIQDITSNDESVFHFPASVEVFHWHGETFDLPPGAVRIAESEGCKNQAFQIGKSVIGLQFHLETTPKSADAIVSHCRDELTPAKYIQSESVILATPTQKYQTINGVMAEVLSYLTET